MNRNTLDKILVEAYNDLASAYNSGYTPTKNALVKQAMGRIKTLIDINRGEGGDNGKS